MRRPFFVSCAVAFGLGATSAFAQSAPAPLAAASPAASTFTPWATRSAVVALRRAYHTIADAQALGATVYLEAAKKHYRGALDRYGRQDAGAASEARAAAALARASIAAHPLLAPADIPAPPAPVPIALGTETGPRGPQRPWQGAGPGPGRPDGGPPPGGMRGRFDAATIAQDAKTAGTPEALQLAQKAVDADIARTRAAFSGNLDEALRQGQLADALALAVRSLAWAEHPPSFQRSGYPGRSGSSRRDTSTVGSTSSD